MSQVKWSMYPVEVPGMKQSSGEGVVWYMIRETFHEVPVDGTG